MIKSTDFFEKLYRGLAHPIIEHLRFTRVTANQVTIFRGLLFIPFCLFLAFYSFIGVQAWVAYITMAIGIQIWDVLDCVDGGLARATGNESKKGEILEMFFDRAIGHTAGLFGLCLTVGLYFEYNHFLLLVLGFMVASGWYLKTEWVKGNQAGETWRDEANDIKKSLIGEIMYFFHYRELGVFSVLAILSPLLLLIDMNTSLTMLLYLLFYSIFHHIVWIGIAAVQMREV